MEPKPCWFIAPRACLPNGLLRLGNIIRTPADPEDALYESPHPLPTAEQVDTFCEDDFHFDRSASKGKRAGVATSFLQFLTDLGADFDTEWTRERRHQLTASKMTTMNFRPSAAFVRESANQEMVQDYRKRSWKCPYMVVGVMIASGASRNDESSTNRDIGVQFSVGGTTMGIPVSGGPKIGFSQANEVQIGSASSDDFVFAFRLRKVKIRKGESTLQKHYRDGALFDQDAAEEDYDEYERSIPLIYEGLADEDAKGQHFGLEDTETQDETSGQACLCVMLE